MSRVPAVRENLSTRRLRVLFLVEGFTDIRFVAGLNEICALTMLVPAEQYRSSGLKQRVEALALAFDVAEITGGRAPFQLRSLRWVVRNARRFDVILAQEVLRGALTANLAGRLRRVPVVTYMGIAPVEYFRCRRERGQLGWLKATIGEGMIRTLMRVNGLLAARSLAMGPYLEAIARRYSARTARGLYYGVDTERFRPANQIEREALRERLQLPRARLLVLLSSRISHEKDPETVLRAVAIARGRGLDAVLLNLGGDWRQFKALAASLGLEAPAEWVIARPAAHPMTEVFDYFRAVDAVAMASLAEGAAYSTLEALACGTPVVATAVGGMAAQLNGLARLVPRRGAEAMAEELLWIAANPSAARGQALKGRKYIIREWDRRMAFDSLQKTLGEVVESSR